MHVASLTKGAYLKALQVHLFYPQTTSSKVLINPDIEYSSLQFTAHFKPYNYSVLLFLYITSTSDTNLSTCVMVF